MYIQENFEERIEKHLTECRCIRLDFLTASKLPFFYKVNDYFENNVLNVLKYGNFLYSISKEEIEKMSKDEKEKYEFSKNCVDESDKIFLEKLLEVSKWIN
jgi:hypothetical protein